MSKAEKFIEEHTNTTYNYNSYAQDPMPWLTPDQARKAVDIAREETIDKVIGWIEEINNHHHIIRYSDSCGPSLGELTEWFKNYMKEGGKDE